MLDGVGAVLAAAIGRVDLRQEVRAWRTTVVKPGRPSEDYLLRCER